MASAIRLSTNWLINPLYSSACRDRELNRDDGLQHTSACLTTGALNAGVGKQALGVIDAGALTSGFMPGQETLNFGALTAMINSQMLTDTFVSNRLSL